MKTIQTTWTGIRPLLMHSANMVDPLNPAVIRIREINAKGSKKLTDSDREEIQRLEWRASMYWNQESGLVVPSDNIEKCLREGAAKSRLGKAVEAAILVSEPEVPITGINYPRNLDKLFADPQFQLRKAVRIPPKTGARIMKVRPAVPTGWQLKFSIEFDDGILNEKDLRKAMLDAGSLIGLGDWRPKFGQFLVE